MTQSPPEKQAVVLGGGISGLAAALRLVTLRPQWSIALLEAGPRVGGTLQTQHRDGYLLERGPDMFLTDPPHAVDLCRQVGIEDQLVPTSDRWRGAMVVCRGRPEPLPSGFQLMAPGNLRAVWESRVLSLRGKLRLAAEYFVPPRTDDLDETLEQFARRRLGGEAFERLVQPLVAGIYTADASRLSMQAALPQFVEMERRHGGLIRALRRREAPTPAQSVQGARWGLFVAPRDGMASLAEAVQAKLPPEVVRCHAAVTHLRREADGGWHCRLRDGQTLRARRMIVALPAHQAAELLRDTPPLADELEAIEYASSAVVAAAWPESAIGHPLHGFGLVVPRVENRRILAASFSHRKFPGRAPQGHALIRVFLGGATQADLLDLPDARLEQIALDELRDLLDIRALPEWIETIRWPRAMPQYHVGHVQRVARIFEQAAALGNLALAGSAYRGVGIPHCVASGRAAAEALAAADGTV